MKYSEIIALISGDESLRQFLVSNLELIDTVNKNYKHIIELENLISLFKGGLEPYYKQFCKEKETIVQFCGVVAENTRANHYRREDLFDDVNLLLPLLKNS